MLLCRSNWPRFSKALQELGSVPSRSLLDKVLRGPGTSMAVTSRRQHAACIQQVEAGGGWLAQRQRTSL
jgi:hypothetical protein